MNPKSEQSQSLVPFSPEWLAEIDKKSEEERIARETLRKSLPKKPLSMDDRVVAWVDILGFSEQLENAASEENLRAAYLKMLRVQEHFYAPAASDDPAEQNKANQAFVRSMITGMSALRALP